MHDRSEMLLSGEEVTARVRHLAARLAKVLDDDWTAVCLLTGGLWFAADLMRELYARSCNPRFDALWLASYGGERESSGRVLMHAGLQHEARGRRLVLLDDVLDSGLSLAEARRVAVQAGAVEVLTAVFARKPWPRPRPIEPDFVAWEAPDQFLIGYGMDMDGRHRGLAGVAALSPARESMGEPNLDGNDG